MLKTRSSRIAAVVCLVALVVILVALSLTYPKYGAISFDKPIQVAEGVITALAALATAYFTGTIWRVNNNQLAHSQKIERAYMSGGGYRAKALGMSATGAPVVGETGEFQFCVNNYGKTPGTLYGLGYGFCDESAIPPVPSYTRLYRHNQIDPGRHGEPIARLPIPSQYTQPVVYGRFYYETIYGTRYSSGFIYRIPPNQDPEPIDPPSPNYIRDIGEQQGRDEMAHRSHKPIIIRVFAALKRHYRRHKLYEMEEQTEHQRNERTMARWTRLLGWFTAASTITLFVTAMILLRTDDTSRLRDRAFIYFEDPHPTPYPPGQVAIVAMDIRVVNAGNMPARRVMVRYDCPNAPRSSQTHDPFLLANWKHAEIGTVIGPKQAFTSQGCEIPIDTIKDAQAFKQDVFYVVEAQYIDGFDLDTPRVTQLSRNFRFDQSGGRSLGVVGPHNCSDNDCPK
jgi:hypothetical protein